MTTSLASTPAVVEQPARPCISITRSLPMARLKEASDEIPGLLDWLGEHGHTATGPPFVRYLVIDMAGEMVVQAGVPVAERVEASGEVEAGVLPAGRYVTAVHVGHYDGLYGATRDLLRWAGERDLHFDKRPSAAGEVWASRLEWYETDPTELPDPATWVTRLEFRLTD